SGNLWVTGDFTGTVSYAGSPVTSAGGSDVFVLSVTPTGGLVSVANVGGSGDDVGQGIAVSPAGVFVTGSFSGTADFDPGTGTFNLTSAGGADAFVLRLDSAGGFVGAARMGGTADDAGHGIAADSAGKVWVTGEFRFSTTGL